MLFSVLNICDRVTILPFPLTALNQCIKFHLITFNSFRDMLLAIFIAKFRKGNRSVITCDRVTVLASAVFLITIHQFIKFYLISFFLTFLLSEICSGLAKKEREVTP